MAEPGELPRPPSSGTSSSVTEQQILARLAAAAAAAGRGAASSVAVSAGEACRLKPESLVGKYVLLVDDNRVGLVTAFHRTMSPLTDSMHSIRFSAGGGEQPQRPSRILLRRRKMGSWNSGCSFAILSPAAGAENGANEGSVDGGGGVAESGGGGGGGGGGDGDGWQSARGGGRRQAGGGGGSGKAGEGGGERKW